MFPHVEGSHFLCTSLCFDFSSLFHQNLFLASSICISFGYRSVKDSFLNPTPTQKWFPNWQNISMIHTRLKTRCHSESWSKMLYSSWYVFSLSILSNLIFFPTTANSRWLFLLICIFVKHLIFLHCRKVPTRWLSKVVIFRANASLLGKLNSLVFIHRVKKTWM